MADPDLIPRCHHPLCIWLTPSALQQCPVYSTVPAWYRTHHHRPTVRVQAHFLTLPPRSQVRLQIVPRNSPHSGHVDWRWVRDRCALRTHSKLRHFHPMNSAPSKCQCGVLRSCSDLPCVPTSLACTDRQVLAVLWAPNCCVLVLNRSQLSTRTGA
jgi:hypothetical protein